MPDTLTFQQGYFGDPIAFKGLVDLLQNVFGIDIGLQDSLGGPDPSSMPFGYFDETNRCVANFSAFSMPLAIDGRIVKAAGYQSGAVRPEFRGQGLYRDLMRRAFAWADARGFEAGILLTDKPELYQDYGFRVLPQFRFCGTAPPPASSAGKARDMDLASPEDIALIRGILADRLPVSGLFAVARQTEMFMLNALFNPEIRLSHLPSSDAIIAWKIVNGDILQLLDIAGRRIPLLSEISAAIGFSLRRVNVFFPIDRLGWNGEARSHEGSCALMIRGLEPSDIPQPTMLSPMADF